MGFEKGHKLATGRPKGSGNKINSEVKTMVKQFVNDYLSRKYNAT